RYVTTDQFMREFITSIRFDKCNQFREKYEKIDLLLLDDIQFLSNKEQTQETFFHIFNTLHQKHKQIILSSDTFPKEIKGLQNRLQSRMEWGLVADIQTPDLETKIAILKRKAENQAIKLDDDVADLIASRILSNIRALEGALVRVGAFATLTNQPITLDLAKQVLLHIPEQKNDGIMLEKVLRTVAKHYSISLQDLRSKKRQQSIARARQIAFYLMKKHTISSLQAIGNYIGGRDHSTVIHAIGKIKEYIDDDRILESKVKMIEQDILTG
ncbi:chromosomal replication initiator protein DnaA, partial [Candidatus Babeliales bacterium]|nr:chromosomal replication initiator protein DnaA [Candidatus Babeliales bacterium]